MLGRAAPKIAARLAERREHLLLVNPGLIARYDQMAILETLRDKVGHDVPCPGLWVLVATDGQHDMPMLDHAEIPLITPGQRARVSEAWIDNVHRGRRSQSPPPTRGGQKEAADHGRHQDPPAGTASDWSRNWPRTCSPVRPETPRSTPGCGRRSRRSRKAGGTAQAFEVWREDYLDQVAVAWVLACVFVRFMEDNRPDRRVLAGRARASAGKLAEDTHELFFREHPHDTDREYFQHVFHEVGKIPAARDLFAEGKTPLWAVGPSRAMRR